MAPGAVAILKSTSGRPQGPYANALAVDKPLSGGIDPTLFEDDDGKVYFSYGGGGRIARMADDLSGLADEPQPYHPVTVEFPADGSADLTNARGRTRASVGQEGVSLFKANGRYYLGAALFYRGRYSSVVAVSDNVYGPYRNWHEAVPCGGGTNYFRDKPGNWFCCYFGNDDQSPWREKPGLIKIDFAPDGKIVIAKDQPAFLLAANPPEPANPPKP